MIIDVIIPPRADRPRWLSNPWVFIQDLCHALYVTTHCSAEGNTLNAAWCETAIQGQPDWVEIRLHHRPDWERVARFLLCDDSHRKYYRSYEGISSMALRLRSMVKAHHGDSRGPCFRYTPCIGMAFTCVDGFHATYVNPFKREVTLC